jgi:hypothetical protein
MPTPKEKYFEAMIEHISTCTTTNKFIKENQNAIKKTEKALAAYNATKINSTIEPESNIETALNKMSENLLLVSKSEYSERYFTQNLNDKCNLTKLLENCDLISTVIESMVTKTETTETETKAKTVAKAVLNKMLKNLDLANKATYEAKVVELNANYIKHLQLDRFYHSYV